MKKIFFFTVLFFAIQLAHADLLVKQQTLSDEFFRQPNPQAAEWQTLEAAPVMLFAQNITTPGIAAATLPTASVKAMHNGKWLGVLVEWSDAKQDIHVETDMASDAVAIQFPVSNPSTTSPFMGAKGTAVSIINWKAIWQQDVDVSYQQVKDLYPNTWVDTYMFGKNVAQDAGNPIAQQDRKFPVEELMAEGFGTLTTQKQQDARAKGVWKDGKWSVMFTRLLKSSDKHDPSFVAGGKSAIAFALWQGADEQVGARKQYAPWVNVEFEGGK